MNNINDIPLMNLNPGMKLCPWLNHMQPIGNFYKDTKSKTGLTSHCKDCTKFNRKKNYSIKKIDIRSEKLEGLGMGCGITNEQRKQMKL